jgi:phenylalanyl-tRNA synthetase beta chain
VVNRDVEAGQVMQAAQGADKALISRVCLFDVFVGEGLPDGKKSLGLEITLQPRERTMTDAEIDAVAAKVVAQVQKATGATLRG